jgi:hypothetical protein
VYGGIIVEQEKKIIDLPIRDSHEMTDYMKNSFLNTYFTSALAAVAPYLAIARAAEPLESIGHVSESTIKDVKELKRKGGTVLRVHITIRSGMKQSAEVKTKSDLIIYTFKNISPFAFEPFVIIGEEKNGYLVIAYAEESQFLMEKIESQNNEETILRRVHSEAIKKGMRSLGRYVDLIIG